MCLFTHLRHALVVVALFSVSAETLAQQADSYVVPLTEYGHPDFQGIWEDGFLTMLERPIGFENLIANPEQAQALVAGIRSNLTGNVDPDIGIQDLQQLAMVKGEYRTSIIVSPPDGRIPYTEAGLELVAWSKMRDEQLFDHPEQRPLVERCLESFGYPPMRSIPVAVPRKIVQNRDHVVIFTEDAAGYRVIRLEGRPPPEAMRSVEGYSIGHWQGDTLVVETTHFLAADPARFIIGRPVLLSPATRIVERFTRVSPTELFYQYTVEDDELYTQPWSGEFSLTWLDAKIYEYACHEGNYSLPNTLRGGQMQTARPEAVESETN